MKITKKSPTRIVIQHGGFEFELVASQIWGKEVLKLKSKNTVNIREGLEYECEGHKCINEVNFLIRNGYHYE